MPENSRSLLESTDGKRPYRSHSSPACLACRRRKSRCTTRNNAESCISCDIHNTECHFPTSKNSKTAARDSLIRESSVGTYSTNYDAQRQAEAQDFTDFEEHNHQEDALVDTLDAQQVMHIEAEHPEENSHVVSPAFAEDNEILQSYIAEPANPRIKRVISRSDASKIILFTSVPRSPVGTTHHQSLASSKCEVIEKLIGPHTSAVLMLYCQYVNKCFPIFDDRAFEQILADDRKQLSRALIANLYANALTFWHNSHWLTNLTKPDQRFTWILANEALHSELFLLPGTSTIIASLLNIGGRPSTSLFGNGSLIGSAIGLANALGLNHDPSTWNITPSEKFFRVRIWWIIIVYDRWCSLAYGTPLQVNRLQHNVPLPTSAEASQEGKAECELLAMQVFTSLLSLTEVLGLYLEYVYRIDDDYPFSSHKSIKFENTLRRWENELPDQIRKAVMLSQKVDIAGIPNLHLGYLAVKMLLRRIQMRSGMKDNGGSTQYFELQTIQAAEDHVSFLAGLSPTDLKGFWLPMYAQSLTSAATFLLRISVKHKEDSPNITFQVARNMMAILKGHLENGWDLAADCLAVCQPIFDKTEALLSATSPVPSIFTDLNWTLDGFYNEYSFANGVFEGL